MWLAQSAIRRPVLTTVAVIIILVMGAVSVMNLQTDLLPEIQPPIGAVVASYPGAGPHEVLEKVTKPLEKQLGTLAGLKTIQSQSQEGSTLILLEFDWSQDIKQVQNDVISRLNRTDLPEDVGKPNFLKFDPSSFPIMQLSVLDGKRDSQVMEEDVDRIVQSLSKLPGVASADESGLLDRQVNISLDADEMKKYGLTQGDVKDRLEANNVSQPGGIVKDGKDDLTARVVSELSSLKEIRDLTVAVHPGTGDKITLDDVAEVKKTTEEKNVITRTNQKPSIGINVFKQSGANTAGVSQDVRQEIENLNQTLDTDIVTIFDQGKYVEQSVQNVSTTMVGGAVLAMLVLFLFLRSFRSPLIVGVAIPVSVVTAFVMMYFADFSLNIMTLGGLALGVGMLVDNAIVVIENIYRHLQTGKTPKEAAGEGAGEVAAAITASTLTTVFVFVPVVFVSGIVGQLFKEFAFTVSFSLIASLLVSLTIVPVMAAAIMKKPRRGTERQRRNQAPYRILSRLLKGSLTHRKTVLAIALILLLLGGAGVQAVGTEFLPAADEGIFIVKVKMPPGTGLEKTDEVTGEVEKILSEEEDIAHFQLSMGSDGGQNAMFGESGRNIAQIYVNAVDPNERNRTTRSIMDDLRPQLNEVDPEAEVTLQEQSSFEAAGAPNTLEFTVSGKKAKLEKWEDKITQEIEKLDDVQEVTNSRKETKPELQVRVDREKAEEEGLVPAQIVGAVASATRGEVVTRADLEKEGTLDVFLRYEKSFKQSPENLKELPIPTTGEKTVPLSEVADVKDEEGPITINRSDQQNSIEYQVQYGDQDLGTVQQEVEQQLDRIGLPDDLDVKYTGSAELFGDSIQDLGLAAGLAILFVFLVLAAQFESFKYPFVIMLTLPLMVIGVAGALYLTRTPVGVTAMIGLIVLAGIVVNNAIVLVDYINQLKARGLSSLQAIVEGSLTRMRPILMTATTTILGLLPLSLGLGEGTEIQQPMAVAVIGGLLSSTLLTLLVIPVVYSWFDPETRRMNKRDRKEKLKEI
ncbi:efflux RND transporter permease subunit [Paludifilum halophilum]|uniref:MFS transporter n=1 Tax=Paludifilum halophilum TaxID=1642702 RepID=A0A235B763_9BACL|nr:efflux RND transporter permease subunit [Paludifilum halophilum]OYD08136.1 MFS transporter [Paludifilum halophilum]